MMPMYLGFILAAKSLRKLATILLLICFVLNIVGIGMAYWLQSRQLKQEMVAYLRSKALYKTQLVEINLTNTATNPLIKWEDETEFELNGEMYDVVKKDTVGNIQKIYCVADKKESELQQEMVKTNCGNNTKPKNANTLKLFSFFYKDAEPSVNHSFGLQLQKHYSFYLNSLPLTFNCIETPPPKFG